DLAKVVPHRGDTRSGASRRSRRHSRFCHKHRKSAHRRGLALFRHRRRIEGGGELLVGTLRFGDARRLPYGPVFVFCFPRKLRPDGKCRAGL
ncbi:MAG: hypothetical protein AVDCRST_MAG09-1620, partial [uncultured Sphingomonas sp.]